MLPTLLLANCCTCACVLSAAQVIGRVSGLVLLNGADVKPRERRDCELRYLQNVLAEQAAAAAGAAVATGSHPQQEQQEQPQPVQHPRLAELKAKYGQVRWAPEQSASSMQGSPFAASK
jgi:hypothetical protein